MDPDLLYMNKQTDITKPLRYRRTNGNLIALFAYLFNVNFLKNSTMNRNPHD